MLTGLKKQVEVGQEQRKQGLRAWQPEAATGKC
jgi:hypothetical protein